MDDDLYPLMPMYASCGGSLVALGGSGRVKSCLVEWLMTEKTITRETTQFQLAIPNPCERSCGSNPLPTLNRPLYIRALLPCSPPPPQGS